MKSGVFAGRSRLAGIVAAIAATAAVAAGCAAGDKEETAVSAGENASSETAVLEVATTANFITDTVEEVGGERVSVTGLMGAGVDPHLYKASAGDVDTLSDADAIFYNGLFLEGKMAEVLGELSERVPSVAVAEAIPEERLVDPPPGAAPEEEHDPHVWFEPSSWAYAVEAVRDQLIELDPEGEETYRENADALLTEMRELEREGREAFEGIPAQRRLLVTSHDAFEYFGRAFGLDVFAIQGISTAAEATTADVDRVAALVAERDVPVVFVESSVPKQTIEAVIAAAKQRGHEVEIGGELFSDAAGETGTPEGTYVGMVRHNVETIAEGLE